MTDIDPPCLVSGDFLAWYDEKINGPKRLEAAKKRIDESRSLKHGFALSMELGLAKDEADFIAYLDRNHAYIVSACDHFGNIVIVDHTIDIDAPTSSLTSRSSVRTLHR